MFWLLKITAQAAREKAEALASKQDAARRKRELERKGADLERKISGLRSEHEAGAEELLQIDTQVGKRTRLLNTERTELGRLRQADSKPAPRRKAKNAKESP